MVGVKGHEVAIELLQRELVRMAWGWVGGRVSSSEKLTHTKGDARTRRKNMQGLNWGLFQGAIATSLAYGLKLSALSDPAATSPFAGLP